MILGRSASAKSFLLLAAILLNGCESELDGAPDPLACERAAAAALLRCLVSTNNADFSCRTGGPCPSQIRGLLEQEVRAACPDTATIQAAGYGPLITSDALVERVFDACRAEADSLLSRTLGGPTDAVYDGADAAGQACLRTAHNEASTFLHAAFEAQGTCIAQTRQRGTCDTAALGTMLETLEDETAGRITTACGALEDLIAVDSPTYVARAAAQSRCAVAAAYANTGPLVLDCGPRAGLIEPPRGEYIQVVLDEATYGTRCGDGSPYAFQLRLAPEGEPVENILIGLEGGGVCIFENDCARISDDLFEALTDPAPETGIFSNDPNVNPFANWTKVYLPYCTQDVFAGGGTTSNFSEDVVVHRYGALDVRAALRYVRDVVWRELDRSTEAGYSADRFRVLFGGFSAGAFGTIYNYHYLLDDLQWQHTQAYPDAGLALDNGETLGIGSLGVLLISDSPPLGWGSRTLLPPYCFATNCGVGPVLLEATAPRLKQVPDQQFLILSNQVDGVQVATTFFPSTASWINAVRTSYCETRELNGVQYYLPAIPESVHVISPRPDLYASYAVDGVVMRDWLAGAVSNPDAVTDRVEEGNLVEAYPGVEPFDCPAAP